MGIDYPVRMYFASAIGLFIQLDALWTQQKKWKTTQAHWKMSISTSHRVQRDSFIIHFFRLHSTFNYND